jgi:hypothetical protein
MPTKPSVRHWRWLASQLAMERSELPTALGLLLRINIPDMVPLRLGLLPVFVEPRNEWLIP